MDLEARSATSILTQLLSSYWGYDQTHADLLFEVMSTTSRKILKRVFPFTRPIRGVLGEGRRWGGPQRGGPSSWSWQMTLSPLQMLPASRPPHEERGQ